MAMPSAMADVDSHKDQPAPHCYDADSRNVTGQAANCPNRCGTGTETCPTARPPARTAAPSLAPLPPTRSGPAPVPTLLRPALRRPVLLTPALLWPAVRGPALLA